MPDPQVVPFIENDAVSSPKSSISIMRGNRRLTLASGSTAMETSVPFPSREEESTSASVSCVQRSSYENVKPEKRSLVRIFTPHVRNHQNSCVSTRQIPQQIHRCRRVQSPDDFEHQHPPLPGEIASMQGGRSALQHGSDNAGDHWTRRF